jgi:hypothetical protein
MHILTLSPFYPTANDDASGCFIAESQTVLQGYTLTQQASPLASIYRECLL